MGAGIGAGLGSLQSNKNILSLNKETSKNSKNDSLKKITESYSTSFGSGICIDTKDVYKSSINKNNYDVVFVKNVKCILEFLDIELKEKIYYLIQSTYNNQIKIQNGYNTIYVGHLINGVRDGYGTLGNIKYKGFWKNGKREVMAFNFMNPIFIMALTKDIGKKTKRMGLAFVFVTIASYRQQKEFGKMVSLMDMFMSMNQEVAYILTYMKETIKMGREMDMAFLQ